MMIVEGMLLGLAYVLPPGPVTAETVRRSLHGGIPAALAVQLGGVGGDFIYALLVLAGLSQFLNHTAVRPGAGLLGSVLLVVLGISALRGPAVPLTPVAAGLPNRNPGTARPAGGSRIARFTDEPVCRRLLDDGRHQRQSTLHHPGSPASCWVRWLRHC
jgi:threonine/homoserine/homoserine lactone efflux protein